MAERTVVDVYRNACSHLYVVSQPRNMNSSPNHMPENLVYIGSAEVYNSAILSCEPTCIKGLEEYLKKTAKTEDAHKILDSLSKIEKRR